MNDIALVIKAIRETADECRECNDLKSAFLLQHLARNIERQQSKRANVRFAETSA